MLAIGTGSTGSHPCPWAPSTKSPVEGSIQLLLGHAALPLGFRLHLRLLPLPCPSVCCLISIHTAMCAAIEQARYQSNPPHSFCGSARQCGAHSLWITGPALPLASRSAQAGCQRSLHHIDFERWDRLRALPARRCRLSSAGSFPWQLMPGIFRPALIVPPINVGVGICLSSTYKSPVS